MDTIFTKYKWKTNFVYMEDFIVFSENVEEHIRHADEILTSYYDAGVNLKRNRGISFKSRLNTLDKWSNQVMWKPARETSNPWSNPNQQTQDITKSFLRIVQHFLRIRQWLHCTVIAHPFNKLLKNESREPLKCNEKKTIALKKLIEQECGLPGRSIPHPNLCYSL